jgi:hypothetical protein
MHHLSIDHHAGGGHDAITHDGADILDLFQFNLDAFGPGGLFDQRQGALAVGAAGAEYLDIFGLQLKPGHLSISKGYQSHAHDAFEAVEAAP